jgi:putative toxin-antitoxin system antitoxin component (TIGR02293 family)
MEEPLALSRYAGVIGLEADDRISLASKVESGFPFRAFLLLQNAIQLSTEQLASIVRISPRTLTRRREEGYFRADESERVLRISRLFSLALELFEGDADSTRTWLSRPNRALRDRVPLELAKTEIGAREVENLIGRLEHGVFS